MSHLKDLVVVAALILASSAAQADERARLQTEYDACRAALKKVEAELEKARREREASERNVEQGEKELRQLNDLCWTLHGGLPAPAPRGHGASASPP